MKTLLMIVYMIISPHYGNPEELLANWSYVDSHEECTQKAIPYVRKLMATEGLNQVEFYGAMCLELTEEEQNNPINTGRNFWLGLPAK